MRSLRLVSLNQKQTETFMDKVVVAWAITWQIESDIMFVLFVLNSKSDVGKRNSHLFISPNHVPIVFDYWYWHNSNKFPNKPIEDIFKVFIINAKIVSVSQRIPCKSIKKSKRFFFGGKLKTTIELFSRFYLLLHSFAFYSSP